MSLLNWQVVCQTRTRFYKLKKKKEKRRRLHCSKQEEIDKKWKRKKKKKVISSSLECYNGRDSRHFLSALGSLDLGGPGLKTWDYLFLSPLSIIMENDFFFLFFFSIFPFSFSNYVFYKIECKWLYLVSIFICFSHVKTLLAYWAMS